MAVLGRWTGANVAITPGTAYAVPASMFPTQARNDGSAYGWNAATSTLTLPSSGLADGYLMKFMFRFNATGNNRVNMQMRVQQLTGTGSFVTTTPTGYARDTSEDMVYVSGWAFVHNPSASSTFQLSWRRDANAQAGAVAFSTFEVVPLYYKGIGIASSTSNAVLGGTTQAQQITGFTEVAPSEGDISFASNQFTLGNATNKYLVLGGSTLENLSGNTRTQRWAGLSRDSVPQDHAKAYWYIRNSANSLGGCVFGDIVESDGTTAYDLFCFRGVGVANSQGGADNDGGTPSTGSHVMLVLQLNDNAETFASRETIQSGDLTVTGPVDLGFCQTVDQNDAASFSKSSDTAMDVNADMDGLFMANISTAQFNVATRARWTAQSYVTVNGAESELLSDGNYQRNNQGSIDTYGWSANPMGFAALTSGDTVGVSIQELAGGEDGGDNRVNSNWGGFWGINLDTLQATATATRRVFIIS